MKRTAHDLLERAIAIAVEAHAGQKDKNGDPYLLQPCRMMCRVQSASERVVAVLHDVVEDTHWTFKDLKKEGFSDQIVKALDCLTKRDGEEYDQFVRRAASNKLARRVKLEDLKDNMDVRRFKEVTNKEKDKLQKYLWAWRKLQPE